MIKIIEHGILKKEIEKTCDNCRCKFIFTEDECEEHHTGEYKAHPIYEWADDIEIVDLIIKCPECEKLLLVEHDIYI